MGHPLNPRCSRILAFVFLYLLVFVFEFPVMAGLGLDLMSATSSVAASLGNVGPGLIGGTCKYLCLNPSGR